MAQIDESVGVPFKRQIQAVTLEDGDANSITLQLVNTIMTTTETGRVGTALKPRGRYTGTPTIIETDDGSIQMSATFYIASRYGNTAVSAYEMFTGTGGSAGTASTGNGSKRTIKVTVTDNSTVDGGGSQTRTYNYVETTSISEAEGDGGLIVLNWSGIDHENRPTIA